MKVELRPETAQWIEAEVAAGTYPTPEAAVRHAISELRVGALRAKLDAAVNEGGRHSGNDARRYVLEQVQKRRQTAAS